MTNPDWHKLRSIIHEWIRNIPLRCASVEKEQVTGLYSKIRVVPSNSHACPVEFLDYGENAGIEIIAGAFHVENGIDIEDIQDDLRDILDSIQSGRIMEKSFIRNGVVVSQCAEITLADGKKIGSLDKRYWFGLIPVEIRIVQYESFSERD